MNNSANVAKLIKERMKSCGISNKQLSENIDNVNVNTIAQLAKGREISYVTFAKIADYLDCSVDYLLGRTDNPNITADTYIKGNNNGVQAISNGTNSTLTINGTPHSTDKSTAELVELVESLPLVKKAEAIIYLNKLKTNS